MIQGIFMSPSKLDTAACGRTVSHNMCICLLCDCLNMMSNIITVGSAGQDQV